MNRDSKVLIIFVKAPVPGTVKTRLFPALSYSQSAELYRSWVKEIYKKSLILKGVTCKIAYGPHPDFPRPDWIDLEEIHIPFFYQQGNDLGEKLLRAFEVEFKGGAESVAAIGSDSPGLPLRYLEEAFLNLEKNDLVLGPSQDGGYYLIGLKRRAPPELFTDMPWSGSQVFSLTFNRAGALGLKTGILPTYFDIDVPEDLNLLQ